MHDARLCLHICSNTTGHTYVRRQKVCLSGRVCRKLASIGSKQGENCLNRPELRSVSKELPKY
jgi:hypothetical protein